MADTERLCPVCGSNKTGAGFNGSTIGDRCRDCGALWTEAFYRRTGETEVSDVRPGAFLELITADKANAQRAQTPTIVGKQVAPAKTCPVGHTTSHSHQEGDGCPLCGAIHIGIKPHGPLAAECLCIDCGASWHHRYENGYAYRSNIKAPVKQ